jgi:polyisoprenoid-binding protein YceI
VTGGITLGPNGAIVREQSKLAIDLTTLQSDRSNRDRFIQRNPLQTSEFPTAELVPTEVSGLPFPLPTSGEATFKLVGDLTIRGITRPTTWDVSARFEGQEITGSGSTTFRFSDFEMTAPVAGPVVSVEDSLKLEIDFRATRAAA